MRLSSVSPERPVATTAVAKVSSTTSTRPANDDKNDKFALGNLTKHIPKRMKTSRGKVLKLIQPKVTSTLPPIPKILQLAKRFVRVEISCRIDTVRHDRGEQTSTNAPALKIMQLQCSGYQANAFYDELQTKALTHLRKHSPLLLNMHPGYTGTLNQKCMIRYCAQPVRGLHRVWLPLDSQLWKDTPDPATVKIIHLNPSGHAFYVHTYVHIKRDVQPEQPPKTLTPPAQNGEGSPLAAAMEISGP
jgi:hypothetical protein